MDECNVSFRPALTRDTVDPWKWGEQGNEWEGGGEGRQEMERVTAGCDWDETRGAWELGKPTLVGTEGMVGYCRYGSGHGWSLQCLSFYASICVTAGTQGPR